MDAVHVWYLFAHRVTDPAVLKRYDRMMSAEERERRDRFVFAKDRHQFLLSRGLLRTLLARYARIRPEDCAFVTNRYGKPFLRRCSEADVGLEFNVSHTTGLIAVAITTGREVGIDVEELSRTRVDLDVRRLFSPAEVAALEALPQERQRSAFFDYWTLKEAYIKARGMGLSLPLDGFTMQLDGSRPPTIAFVAAIHDDAASWQFLQFDPSPQHRMALAVRCHGSEVPVEIREFDPGNESSSPS